MFFPSLPREPLQTRDLDGQIVRVDLYVRARPFKAPLVLLYRLHRRTRLFSAYAKHFRHSNCLKQSCSSDHRLRPLQRPDEQTGIAQAFITLLCSCQRSTFPVKRLSRATGWPRLLSQPLVGCWDKLKRHNRREAPAAELCNREAVVCVHGKEDDLAKAHSRGWPRMRLRHVLPQCTTSCRFAGGHGTLQPMRD